MKTAHSCFHSSQPFWVLPVTVPYTLEGAVKILKRHYPDLKPEVLQEYLECRDTGLAEKYSRVKFEAYKKAVLSKKERREIHVAELGALIQDEKLMVEELISMGLSPMPPKKPAARKPKRTQSRSTSPETTTDPGKRTLVVYRE